MSVVWRCMVMAAGLGLGIGCGIPKTRYYTLQIPHGGATGVTPSPRHIAVQRFWADRPLAGDRIAYRETAHEVGFYEYHRWSAAPTDLVTAYLVHRLRDRGGYARVSTAGDGGSSDFTLRGTVHRFEEVDRGKEVFATVALEAELVRTRSRVPVWRGEAECTRPLASRDLAGVVGGIEACLDEVSAKLLAAMGQSVDAVKD